MEKISQLFRNTLFLQIHCKNYINLLHAYQDSIAPFATPPPPPDFQTFRHPRSVMRIMERGLNLLHNSRRLLYQTTFLTCLAQVLNRLPHLLKMKYIDRTYTVYFNHGVAHQPETHENSQRTHYRGSIKNTKSLVLFPSVNVFFPIHIFGFWQVWYLLM